MIHEVVKKVEAEPDFVSAFHPACIGTEGVRLIIALEGIPSFRIAEGRIIGAGTEGWQSALQRVGAVGSGNPEGGRAEVRTKVGRLNVLAEPGPAERPVDQEVG